jgi:hypothetical protein
LIVSTKYSFPDAAGLYIVCAAEEADRIIIKKAGSKINLLLMSIKILPEQKSCPFSRYFRLAILNH